MLVDIPGRESLNIEKLVLDYNGTIASDGRLIHGVEDRIRAIVDLGIEVFILTADTHGSVRTNCGKLPLKIEIFDNNKAALNKVEICEKLGADRVVAIGNGYNDGLMLERASLGILVVGTEGASAKTLLKADILCNSILDALDLILKKERMVATLRA